MSYRRDLAREKQCSGKEMSGNLLLKIVLHHYGKVISDLFFSEVFWRKKYWPLGKKRKRSLFYFKCILIFCHGMEQVQERYTFDFFINSSGLIFNLQVFRLNLFNKSLFSTLNKAMYYVRKAMYYALK